MVSKAEILKVIKSLLIQYNDILNNIYARKNNILEKDNEESYTPTGSYHPATKKYVDDLSLKKVDLKDYTPTDNNYTNFEKNKLANIENNANNYIHPSTHKASIITEDSTHKFVTDVEKEIWNNKSDFSGSYNDLTEKPNIPSIDGLSTEVYVDNKVASIVNSAPETLNTLNELATALGNDPNFATTVANQIGTKASNDYVNTELAKKVNSEGYVATENNYSTAEKTKLANVEDNANNYVHPENHEPSIITQDNEHRFVTDKEKEIWNNKLDFSDDSLNTTSKNIPHAINELDSQINTTASQLEQVKSDVETLKNKPAVPIETVQQVNKNTDDNKRQDFYINALYNENTDGRLTIEEEGNDLKLEGSKQGLVEIEKVVGNTLVNIVPNELFFKTPISGGSWEYKYFELTQPTKANTLYTLVFDVLVNTANVEKIYIGGKGKSFPNTGISIPNLGRYCVAVTSTNDTYDHGQLFVQYNDIYGTGELKIEIMCFEGDLTTNPPREYSEGMQSSFEDKLITQEMVDAGEELAENLGKYRVGVKVVGKNLFDKELFVEAMLKSNSVSRVIFDNKDCLKISGDIGEIEISFTNSNIDKFFTIKCYTTSTDVSSISMFNGIYICPGSNVWGVRHLRGKDNQFTFYNYVPGRVVYIDLTSIQLEEGTVATQYEDYKEYNTSILLSSPLLKGDEIVMKEDGLYHYHKMWQEIFNEHTIRNFGKAKDGLSRVNFNTLKPYDTNLVGNVKVICDKITAVPNGYLHGAYLMNCIGITGDGYLRMMILHSTLGIDDTVSPTSEDIVNWLKQNNLKIVYELAEPYYEKISDNKFISEIPNDATLHIDSTIPCQSIKASYTGKLPSVYKLESDISTIEEQNVDIIATSWDTDYRVCEIEWVLEDAGLTTPISLNNIKTGGNTMALSRFEQAKIIILGDAYYRPTFQKQLETYLKRGYLAQEEFDTLISMMDAREAIKGEIV